MKFVADAGPQGGSSTCETPLTLLRGGENGNAVINLRQSVNDDMALSKHAQQNFSKSLSAPQLLRLLPPATQQLLLRRRLTEYLLSTAIGRTNSRDKC